jgi:arylsulfatase B
VHHLIGNAARLAMAAVGVWLLGANPAEAAERSILLILADDVGVDASTLEPTPPRYATTPPAAPTPRLLALAKRGVLFTNAWATPGCSPTRATIFTGRYGFRTGVGSPIPPERDSPIPSLPTSEFGLPKAFKAAMGDKYLLAHIGKWHLSRGTGDPNDYGWPYFAGPDPSQTTGDLPDYFNWPKTVNKVTHTSTTYNTTDVVNEAIGQIHQAGAHRPYFLWVAFSAAHAPFHKPPNELHSRDSLPVDGGRPYRRAYYEAMIEAMDTEIGRLLAEVDLNTTTVIYLGDNGTPGGVTAPPYDANRAKLSVYEGGVRVPFLIAGAGVAKPGRRASGLVSTVDLFPTILELAGISPSAALPPGTRIDGVSLLPVLSNAAVGGSVRRFAYTETFPVAYDVGFDRAIRTPRYKLIAHTSGTRELYDLGGDPFERTNLLGGALTDVQKSQLRYLNRRLDALLASR